jgi:hypothetical protein
MVSLGLVLKSVAQIFWFVPQNQKIWFVNLYLRITATFSWFGYQNQGDFDLSVAL